MSQPEPLTEQQLDEIAGRTNAGSWGVYEYGNDGSVTDITAEVRRLRARHAAPEATSAPLAASQPSEAPAEPETATEAPTGRVGDPRRTLTPNEYDSAWHAVEGAAGEEGADPGTVLHAVLNRLGIEWREAAQPTA